MLEQPIVEHPHEEPGRMPAARDQTSIDRPFGRLFIDVKRLRIELPREGNDLVGADAPPAQVEAFTDFEVFEVPHRLRV